MKRIVFGILIIGVGMVIWLSQSPDKSVKKIALKNGINYLLTTNDRYNAGSSLLAERLSIECEHAQLWKHVGGKYQEDLQYNSFLQERYASRENDDPDFSDMKNNQGGSDFSRKEIAQVEQQYPSTDKIMIKASNCEKFTYESIMDDINQIKRDRGGYNSAHILMALGMSRNRGCYEDRSEELSVFIEDLVDELTEAQARTDQTGLMCDGPNIDIYAERALFISDAGYPLKDEWVENILSCQQADGGWFSPHTTGLSLLTIAATLENC